MMVQPEITNSLCARVIPCLDVHNGRVVKGEQFVRLQDQGDPVELAKKYEDEGADSLVFLDITATTEKRNAVVDLVKRVTGNVFIPFAVGGGVRTLDDAKALLDSGCESVSVNSAAVGNPGMLDELANIMGSQNLILAIDAKRNARRKSWEVFIAGGRTATGKDVVEWAKEGEARGVGEILLTSIDRDGSNQGYDLDLLQAVSSAIRKPVIASGGAGCVEHFSQAILEGGADAVLCAGTLHRGELTIAEIKAHMHAAGIRVRPTEPAELRKFRRELDLQQDL